jgi:hypothetical protein
VQQQQQSSTGVELAALRSQMRELQQTLSHIQEMLLRREEELSALKKQLGLKEVELAQYRATIVRSPSHQKRQKQTCFDAADAALLAACVQAASTASAAACVQAVDTASAAAFAAKSSRKLGISAAAQHGPAESVQHPFALEPQPSSATPMNALGLESVSACVSLATAPAAAAAVADAAAMPAAGKEDAGGPAHAMVVDLA